MPQQGPAYETTLGQFTEEALKAWHGGDDASIDATLQTLSWLQYARDPGVRQYANRFERELLSAFAHRSGLRDEARGEREKLEAQVSRMLLSGTEGQMAVQESPEYQAAKSRLDYLRQAERELDFGDQLQGKPLFGDARPRTRVTTEQDFFGGTDPDAYYMDPGVAGTPIGSLLRNPDGSPKLGPTWRRQVLEGQPYALEGREGIFVDTDLGPADLTEAYARVTDHKETVRRSALGLQDPKTQLEGIDVAPGTIQRWATDLAGKEGFTHNVETALVGARVPTLPNLFPEFGPQGGLRTHDFLNTAAGAKAYWHAVSELQEAGELRMTTGEAAATMGSHLIDFIAVNKGLGALGRGVKATGIAGKLPMPAATKEFMERFGRRALRSAAEAAHNKKGIRAVGVVFDKRNILEEIAYAVTRNAITGQGTGYQGAAEGFAEGVTEGLIWAGWRGMFGLGTAVAGGVGRLPVLRELPMHPLEWAHKVKSSPVLKLREEMSLPKAASRDLRRRLENLNVQGLSLDMASQSMDAVVMGAAFGAYQGARSEAGPAWEAMSLAEKAALVAENVAGPEAAGQMLAYGLVSSMFGGASIARMRGAAWRERFPDASQQVEEAASGVAAWHLGRIDNIERFVQEYETLRAANPELSLWDDVEFDGRSPTERTSGAEFRAALDELEAHGAKQSTRAEAPGWTAARHTGGEWRDVDPEREQDGVHRLWHKEGSPYAVKRLDTPDEDAFVIVREDDPNHVVARTSVWTTFQGAASQADAIVRSKERRAEEEARRERGTAPGQGELEVAGEGDPDLVEQLTPETVPDAERRAQAEADAELAVQRAEQRAEDARASADAHATDPEHLGKRPDEVAEAERQKRLERTRKVATGERKRRTKAVPRTPREIIGAAGGMTWHSDFAGAAEGKARTGGFKAGMHGVWMRKEGKGGKLSWEQAADLLLDAGYEPDIGPPHGDPNENPGISRDRLFEILSGNEPPPTAERIAEEGAEIEAEALEAAEAADEFQAREAGFESAEDARAWRAANAPPDPLGAVGEATSEAIVGAVDAMVESATLPADVHAAQAGNRAATAYWMMRRASILPEDATESGWRFAHQLHFAARNLPVLVEDMIASGGFSTDADARRAAQLLHNHARDAVAYTQQASIALAKEEGGDIQRQVNAYWLAREHDARNVSYGSDLRTFLREADMLGPDESRVGYWVGAELQRWFEAKLAAQTEGSDSAHMRHFWSFNPLHVFTGGDPYVRGNEFFVSRLFRSNALTQALGRNENPLLRKVRSGALGYQRLLGRFYDGLSLSRQAADMNRRAVDIISVEEATKINMVEAVHEALHDLHAPFGMEGADQKTWEVFYELIDSGALAKMKSADDVERLYGKRYRYLFDVGRKMTEAFDAIGERSVRIGWMDPESFARLQGRYVMHAYIKEQLETQHALSRDGDYYGVLAGRNLERGGEHERAVRITHPHVFRQSALQETKANQLFGVLHGLIESGVVIPRSVVAEGAHSFELEQFETAAFAPRMTGEGVSRSERRAGINDLLKEIDTNRRDPINGRKAKRRQVLFYETLRSIEENMQNEEGTKPEPPGDHLRPWTPRMQHLLDTFLGVKAEDGTWIQEPGVVTSGVLQQIEVLLDSTFAYQAIPKGLPGHRTQKFGQLLNAGMLYWRRQRTIHNPKHWVLSRVSDVLTNWETGVVPITDFISSMTLGKGSYAEAMGAINDFHAWSESGRPRDKPADWSGERWDVLQDALQSMDLLYGSTYATSMLESGRFAEFFAAQTDPDAFFQAMREKIQRETADDEGLQTGLEHSLAMMVSMMAPGKLRWERKILERMGHRDAMGAAEAVMDFQQEYQVWEFFSKYAGIRHLRKKNPKMSLEDAAREAARGTVDYRGGSVNLRQWSTNFNIWDGRKGMSTLAALGRAAIANPFIIYSQGMAPTRLRNMVARPLQTGASVALWMGLIQLFQDGMDDDERDDFYRSRAGSSDAPGRAYLTQEEAEAILERTTGWLAPSGNGSGTASPDLRRKLWPVLVQSLALAPHEMPAPSRGMHSRFSDFQDMLGSAQGVTRPMRVVRDWSAMTNRDKVLGVYEALEGFLPAAAIGIMGDGAKFLEAHLEGGDSARVTAGILQNYTQQISAPLTPGPLAFFSAPSQHAFEGLVLGQQTLPDWFAGRIPGHSEKPEEALGEVLYSAFLPSRANRPYRALGEDATVLDSVVMSIFPKVTKPRSADAKQRRHAARMVFDQILETSVGQYHAYRRGDLPPAELMDSFRRQAIQDSFQARLAERLDINRDLTADSTLERPALKPDRELETDIGKRLAQIRDPELQRFAIISAQRFLAGDAWRGPIRSLLLEQAELRNVTPDELAAMYRASIVDDRGRGLIKLYHGMHVEGGSDESAAATYRVFYTLPVPDAKDGAWKHYQELLDYYEPNRRGKPAPPKGMIEALPEGGIFAPGKDVKPARKSREAVRLFQRDLR